MGYVYLFNLEGTDIYKIGNSKHPDKRRLEIQTSCPFKVVEVMRFESNYPVQVEMSLHKKFGFQKASKWNIKCPFEVPDEAFMAIELTEKAFEGKAGRVRYPDEFMEVE